VRQVRSDAIREREVSSSSYLIATMNRLGYGQE
jgi:hypothetical protein